MKPRVKMNFPPSATLCNFTKNLHLFNFQPFSHFFESLPPPKKRNLPLKAGEEEILAQLPIPAHLLQEAVNRPGEDIQVPEDPWFFLRVPTW